MRNPAMQGHKNRPPGSFLDPGNIVNSFWDGTLGAIASIRFSALWDQIASRLYNEGPYSRLEAEVTDLI